MIFAAELVKRTKNVMFLIVNAKVEHFARKPANSVVFSVIVISALLHEKKDFEVVKI